MAVLQKLDRLLAAEIISLTFVITASLSSIMMMAKIPRYTNILFSAPDNGITFLMLLLYIFPSIIKFTVPIALLLASAIVTIRMAADRELEAWMASGVSVLRFAVMPTCLGIIVMLISLFSALFFEPYSNKQFEKYKWFQSRSIVEAILKNSIREKSFIYDVMPTNHVKLSLFMNTVSNDRSVFGNIFLALKQPNEAYFSNVVSSSGALKKEIIEGYPDYLFYLYNGTAYSVKSSQEDLANFVNENPKSFILTKKNISAQELSTYPNPSDWTITRFSEMNISLISLFKSKLKDDESFISGSDTQLYPFDYLKMIQKEQDNNPDWRSDTKIIEKLIFIFKQISVPISTIFLPIIGVCLGIQDPRRKQIGVYLGVGLVIFALYASISIFQQLALNFILSPFIMLLATPLTLIFIIMLLLRWRLRHPPSTGFIAFIKDDLLKIKIFSKKG
jgi:lipopolysaccharide export LptBFGC system permease protein LptF